MTHFSCLQMNLRGAPFLSKALSWAVGTQGWTGVWILPWRYNVHGHHQCWLGFTRSYGISGWRYYTYRNTQNMIDVKIFKIPEVTLAVGLRIREKKKKHFQIWEWHTLASVEKAASNQRNGECKTCAGMQESWPTPWVIITSKMCVTELSSLIWTVSEDMCLNLLQVQSKTSKPLV